ncbi:hypothetical protein ACFO5K_21300 [Nocardia halotolerans]|uniref:Uncharacterized protein n=1 Tax=Nocardia halotolerans TaxID=1755878 RepID=A0ABV8VLG4_9NOCA
MEQVRAQWPSRASALIAGWLGVLVGVAGIVVATVSAVLRSMGRGVDLDYVWAGIVGGLGAGYLLGAVLLLRRRMIGRRLLVGISAAMSGATLLVVVLNKNGHRWGLEPLDWWLALNVVILVLSVIEPTRRWAATR